MANKKEIENENCIVDICPIIETEVYEDDDLKKRRWWLLKFLALEKEKVQISRKTITLKKLEDWIKHLFIFFWNTEVIIPCPICLSRSFWVRDLIIRASWDDKSFKLENIAFCHDCWYIHYKREPKNWWSFIKPEKIKKRRSREAIVEKTKFYLKSFRFFLENNFLIILLFLTVLILFITNPDIQEFSANILGNWISIKK